MSTAVAQFLYGFFGMLMVAVLMIGSVVGLVLIGTDLWGSKMPSPEVCGMCCVVGCMVVGAIVVMVVVG